MPPERHRVFLFHMAKDKKAFTAYCDWIETFNTLPDDKAGALIKHILAYVNDQDPQTDDLVINAAFAQIKATLKRDLKKWEAKCEQNRENVRKRWNKKDTNVYERIRTNTKHTDRDKDRDRDNTRENKKPDRKFGKSEFLEWFNKTRTEHLKQPSNFKVLTYYDQTNLLELTKNYTGEDFVKAFKNMIKDGWAKTNNKVTPDHFLKPENFNKYLNTNKKQSLN